MILYEEELKRDIRVFLCGLQRTGKHFVRDIMGLVLDKGEVGGPYPGSPEYCVYTYDIGHHPLSEAIGKCIKERGEENVGVIITERKWDHLFQSHQRRSSMRKGDFPGWKAKQSGEKDAFEAFLSEHPKVRVERLWSPEESRDWKHVARVIRAFFPEIPEEEIELHHRAKYREPVRGGGKGK